jgi:holo-[acyl-carrier protein] synthase
MDDDSFSYLFVADGVQPSELNPPVNEAINPSDGAIRSPAIRASGRRRVVGSTLSLVPGSPLPEGTDMPRIPLHAPKHTPDVRIGCDVHAVAQTAASIELFGERYLSRVFSPVERAQTAGVNQVERLAGRFAAKEAVMKVLRVAPDSAVPLNSIEVRTGSNGVPFAVLSGEAARLAESQGISRIDISLSHDAGVAMAVAAATPVHPHLSHDTTANPEWSRA